MTPESSPELSQEFFAQDYRENLSGQRVPLVYSRQSFSGKDSGLHLHEDHYALYIVNGGRGVHEINGQPYGIARGDVYLAPPGSVHAYRNFQNLEVDFFVFQTELFNAEETVALRALPGFRGLFLKEHSVTSETENWREHRLHLAPEKWENIEQQTLEIKAEIERAHQEYSTQFPEAPLLARVLFFRFLVTLARLWNENIPTGNPFAYRHVELAEVLQFCEANFGESVSVPQMAAKMFLSPSRFSEIFKAEMGVPPGEYLRRLRLNQAQTLLKNTRQSAGEIATQCGFSDAAQFSRAFKAAFGATPSEYRKRFYRPEN